MKVTIKGKGNTIDLGQREYLAAGGQGSVYVKSGIAYKIYNDPIKMIPTSKIAELHTLKNPNIIKPEDVLINDKNKSIGYTMKFVKDTFALCQIFPKPFRSRNNIKPDTILKLVRRMQETTSAIHAENILIVDYNEMNFLVDDKFSEVYFIDVDSYQTPSFPANALMETVRDRHSTKFSQLTDWFSFGIVTYQMFRGIHPYKGKHQTYSSLDDRMIRNISIHNSAVSYPNGAVLPMDVIPQAYQDWYKAVFDDGKRVPPPNTISPIIHVITPQLHVSSGKLLDFIPLMSFSRKDLSGDVLKLYRSGNTFVCLTTKTVYVENRGEAASDPNMAIGFTNKKNIPVGFVIDEPTKSVVGIRLDTWENFQTLPSAFKAESIMAYDGRIYIKQDGNILQLITLDMGVNLHLTSVVACHTMENATKLYEGCSIQNMLGMCYVNIFPEDKRSLQFKLPEVTGQIIAAKYDSRVLMIVTSEQGKYQRYVIVFNKDFSIHQTQIVKDITYTGLNFVVLDQGLCVNLNEEDAIEIFHVDHINNVKVLKDDSLHGLQLLKDGSQVIVALNGKLFQLRMK